jgi:hypothetical protein
LTKSEYLQENNLDHNAHIESEYILIAVSAVATPVFHWLGLKGDYDNGDVDSSPSADKLIEETLKHWHLVVNIWMMLVYLLHVLAFFAVWPKGLKRADCKFTIIGRFSTDKENQKEQQKVIGKNEKDINVNQRDERRHSTKTTPESRSMKPSADPATSPYSLAAHNPLALTNGNGKEHEALNLSAM